MLHKPKRSFRTVHRRWPTGAEDGRPERKCDMSFQEYVNDLTGFWVDLEKLDDDTLDFFREAYEREVKR